MTISIEQLLERAQAKLLQASVDMIAKDKQIAALKLKVALQTERIGILEAQVQRSRLPFKRDLTTPALLRPQAG